MGAIIKTKLQDKVKDIPLSFIGMIVALGIVYGDIGTSPLYVMKACISGNGGMGNVNETFIIGCVSLVMWTVTLLTTIKYGLIAMSADNHGEGGIFALYSLVRKYGKWLAIPAMLGGAAFLASGSEAEAATVAKASEAKGKIVIIGGGLAGVSTAARLSPVLITSSTISTRLSLSASASSLPRQSVLRFSVVIEFT